MNKKKAENTLIQQVFSIPLGKKKYLIYAPLKEIAFIANPALVNMVFDKAKSLCQSNLPSTTISHDRASSKKEGGVLDFLQELDFFRPEPIPVDDYCNIGVQYDSVILFLTNLCNLRCTYCYASSGEYLKREMPWEIAKAGIDYVMEEVIKNKSSAMTLGFHGGGEPTLNWSILTSAVDYAHSLAEKNGITLYVSASTNGCWSKKTLNYIINNFTELSLSFDGLPFVQNTQRPMKNKKDSFPMIKRTLNELDKADFLYGIRMTVTNKSVYYLADSVSFICENFRPQKIQVEPVFLEGRAKRNRSQISNLDVFIEQFQRGFKIAEEHNIILYYSGARLEALTNRFCLAACRSLVVTQDGDVTTCFEVFGKDHPLSKRFFVGAYVENEKFIFNEKKRDERFGHTLEQIPYCESCFCKWHCAGDCAIKTCPVGAGDAFQPTDRCYVNQELTKFLILERIKENGGTIWLDSHQG